MELVNALFLIVFLSFTLIVSARIMTNSSHVGDAVTRSLKAQPRNRDFPHRW